MGFSRPPEVNSQKSKRAGLVTIELKVDSADELIRVTKNTTVPLMRAQKGLRDESLHGAPCDFQAIAKTTWATKAHAESYVRVF